MADDMTLWPLLGGSLSVCSYEEEEEEHWGQRGRRRAEEEEVKEETSSSSSCSWGRGSSKGIVSDRRRQAQNRIIIAWRGSW